MEINLSTYIDTNDIENITPEELGELFDSLTQKDQIEFLKLIEDDIEFFKGHLDFLKDIERE